MVVQVAIALRAHQDKELAREKAAKEAAATQAHREQVLTREQNTRLNAELAHTVHVAQQTTDLEAARVATLAKATEQVAREATLAKARDEALQLHIRL
jgi:hypothetical protein